MPTAISVEPPPTSTTATRPGSGRPSVRVAPRKASRASSSPSSTQTSTPPCSQIAAQNSSRLAARRITAVATVRIVGAPACSASASCSATTLAVSAIRAAGISPPACSPRPRRVNARRCSTSVRRPSRASATSTRVVFVPMSMQPQSMRCGSDVAMMGPMTSGVPAIEVTGLSKAYGSQQALRGVDFTVARGEVFGLLGPNGAGKTTTVEVLEGYRARDAGEVRVLGHDPGGRSADLRARVGIVLQSCGTYPHLTVRETVEHWASLYPAPRRVDEVLALAGLDDCADRRARTLSGGQARRLDFALALVGDPELIFLDEPTTGFDPAARRAAWDVIRALRDLGKTVVLTTHYLDEAQALADRVAILQDGLILAEGPPDALGASRYRVAWRGADGTLEERFTDDPTALLAS